jgi:hypothetical protein
MGWRHTFSKHGLSAWSTQKGAGRQRPSRPPPTLWRRFESRGDLGAQLPRPPARPHGFTPQRLARRPFVDSEGRAEAGSGLGLWDRLPAAFCPQFFFLASPLRRGTLLARTARAGPAPYRRGGWGARAPEAARRRRVTAHAQNNLPDLRCHRLPALHRRPRHLFEMPRGVHPSSGFRGAPNHDPDCRHAGPQVPVALSHSVQTARASQEKERGRSSIHSSI